MRPDNESSPVPPLPAALALASLAAQSRFAGLPEKHAVSAALALYREAQRRVEDERELADLCVAYYVAPLAKLRMPKVWPASFNDFLKRAVQGKDRGERLHRFRDFLCWQVQQSPGAFGIKPVETEAKAAEKYPYRNYAEAKAAVEREKKKYVVTEATLLEIVPKLLAEYESKTYSEAEFRHRAIEFRHYWKAHTKEKKSQAGTRGAAVKAGKVSHGK
jgi:hypothetical protein